MRKHTLSFFVAAMTLCASAAPLQCLEIKTATYSAEILGYVLGGLNYIKLDPLNDRLRGQGLPTVSNNFGVIGGGGYVAVNNIMFGGEGDAFYSKKGTRGDIQTSVSGTYSSYRFGYIVYSRNDVRVYPMIGGGVGQLNFKVLKAAPAPFNDILSNPNRGSSLVRTTLTLDLSIGLDKLTALYKGEDGSGGLDYGIRAGYVLPVIKGKWKEDGREVAGGPDVQFSGIYIKFILGFKAVQKITVPISVKI